MANNIFLLCLSSLDNFKLTLREVKHYLRVIDDEEDDFINSLISSAYDVAEKFLCMSLSTKTWKLSIDSPDKVKIRLPMSPVISISSVTGFNLKGDASVIPSDHYYISNSKDSLIFKQFPFSSSMDIEYIAGYGELFDYFPGNLKQGILYHIALMFDMRSTGVALPANSTGLYKPFRRYNF